MSNGNKRPLENQSAVNSPAWFYSVNTRITLIVLLILLIVGFTTIVLSARFNERSHQQLMQSLNSSVAMYITDQVPLITDVGVQEQHITTLADRAMIINPALEIYILDPEGRVLSHRVEGLTATDLSINIEPLKQFLEPGSVYPVYGSNPRRPDEKVVFTASPIVYENELKGYVYAVIGGELYLDLQSTASSQHLNNVFVSFVGIAVFACLIVGGSLVFVVTRPLRRLHKKVLDYNPFDDKSVSSGSSSSVLSNDAFPPINASKDEIKTLESSFEIMQAMISEQLEAIDKMDKTRRELVANVSHDLRTPLAAMQGTLELLILDKELDRQQFSEQQMEQHLRNAFRQSQRLTRLVNDLFELAKLETNAMTPSIESFSVLELVQDCGQEFEALASRKNISLVLDASAEAGSWVRADISLIQRVLENLISNAIVHTPAGGKITLSVVESEDGATVAVADTGVGIASTDIPHVFDRFYQAKNTEHSSDIGSGLGLAIVKRILSLHDVPIRVFSELNTGTRFEFELHSA